MEIPNEDNKILKCNPIEKSMKVPFFIYADWVFPWKNKYLIIIILKNNQRPKQIHIQLLIILCLHSVHLMQQNIDLIVIEVKIVWSFCKDLKEQ